jgi:Uma2 family endonuclease
MDIPRQPPDHPVQVKWMGEMEEAEQRRHPFSVAEFVQMARAGVFARDARVELVDGEVIDVPPADPPHAGTLVAIQDALARRLGRRAQVRTQQPLVAETHSQPEPDVALVRWDDGFYRDRHPVPADTFAVVEVSWSSLIFDRGVKLRMYARAGVPEYWIVDVRGGTIEIHRQPNDLGYAEKNRARRGDSVAFAAFPDVMLSVDALLG